MMPELQEVPVVQPPMEPLIEEIPPVPTEPSFLPLPSSASGGSELGEELSSRYITRDSSFYVLFGRQLLCGYFI